MNSLPTPTPDRAQYVPYELENHRVEAIWDRLREGELSRSPSSQGRLSTLRARAVPMTLGAVALAAAVMLMVSASTPEEHLSAWSGARLQTGDEAVKVALADGSEIEAAPQASLELMRGSEREVRLALHRGAGNFKVAKNKQRTFVVEAGPVQVRVVGTQFRVTRDVQQQQVEVSVREGIVEVEAFGETRRLLAGETLRLPTVPPSTSDETEAEAKRPQARERSQRKRPSKPSEARETPRREEAKDLLEAAQGAQAAGQRRKAAGLYADLVDRFPTDARAPLSSFELGRVRMDHLGDARGAMSALSWSLKRDNMPFKEDAMARLVRAADSSHDARCQTFRSAYLKAYPEGRYAEDVSLRCGGPEATRSESDER